MIEISQLCKYYGTHRALGPIDVSIEQGEIVGLLGLNGAGKTTALRILTCDLLPSSGSVKVDGLDVVEHPDEVRGKIGYLPDRPPLYDEMTVHEYLRYAASLRGVAAGKTDGLAMAAEEAAGLKRVRRDPIHSLSHGFRQRVGIAQAIVHEPSLVVLDEPISGLDPVQIVEMRELVRRLGGKHTVLLSSHILGEISETCDRILVIGDGNIIASGTEEELTTRFAANTRVQITVRQPEGKDARAAFQGVPGVLEVAAVAATEGGDEVRSYDVLCESDLRDKLSAAAVHAGCGLLELSRSAGDLENIFIKLTGGSLQAEKEAA